MDAMDEWLRVLTEYAILLIDAIALVMIVAGTLQALFSGLSAMPSAVALAG